jgi:hypothetical protein
MSDFNELAANRVTGAEGESKPEKCDSSFG